MANPTDELAQILSKVEKTKSQELSRKLAWKFGTSNEAHMLKDAISSKMPVYPTRFRTINRMDGSVIMVEFDSSMVGYWSFDDPPTGSIIYDAVRANRNLGTATNTAFVDGKYNDCLSFNGTSAYAQIGGVSTHKWLHGADDTSAFKWTIEMWVKVNSLAATNFLFSTCPNGSSTDIGVFSYVTTSGEIFTTIVRGVGGATVLAGVTSSAVVAIDTWYHIALTYDQSLGSNNYTLYVDGVSKQNLSKTVNTPSTADSSQALVVGAQSPVATFMNGYIDEFRIYNSVLSSVRIGQHARNYRFP